MASIEDAIRGLECCTQDHCDPTDCPYYPEMQGCEDMLKRHALELLKAQQSRQTGKWIVKRKSRYATCSICGHSYPDVYDIEDYDNYCRHCGAKMEGLKCDE